MTRADEGKSSIAFGTTLDRELLPLKVPPTRFGNQLQIPRAPNLGPGRYNNDEVSTLTYELEHRPGCKKGYSLGARTAERFQKPLHLDTPGPQTHQEINGKPREFKPAFRPFQTGASRLPPVSANSREHVLPGPGTYEHKVSRNRKVKYLGSFGGPQTLVTSIRMKCTGNGEKDKFKPKGDYYEYKNKALCRPCYDKNAIAESKFSKSVLSNFTKVRDCSSIHNHEGTNAKLRLMTEKDLKKLRNKEAYFSLYF
ncbi:protein pitchfork-like [Dendronephthya gigantea]|uniref:protein pitchfork-like n=1 Tax=Dendronephthya gigantea TaxID=151771 RepID=UPI00106BD2BB|nr:protein pitchfork-like [Dendronephthya gigantea]